MLPLPIITLEGIIIFSDITTLLLLKLLLLLLLGTMMSGPFTLDLDNLIQLWGVWGGAPTSLLLPPQNIRHTQDVQLGAFPLTSIDT